MIIVNYRHIIRHILLKKIPLSEIPFSEIDHLATKYQLNFFGS